MMHHHHNTRIINDENAYTHQHHQQYLAQKPTTATTQQRSVFGDVSNHHNIQQKQYNQVASKPVQQGARAPLSNMTGYQAQQVKPLSSVQQQPTTQQQIPSYRYSTGVYQQHVQHQPSAAIQQQTTRIHAPTMSERTIQLGPDSPVQQEYQSADRVDSTDPKYCLEYAAEIYQHQKNIERRFLPPQDYMTRQHDLSEHMRSVLVDWLVEVHESFELMPETLFLCINLVDRFLAVRAVVKSKLQLVGISALLIAAKYEEIQVPELEEFINVAANAYSREELIHMERIMLTTLDFNVTVSTCYIFLTRFLKIASCSHRAHFLAYMLTELTLLVTASYQFTPSMIACAAVYLSQKYLVSNSNAWNSTLQQSSGYSESDLRPCAQLMLGLVKMQIQEAQKPKDKKTKLVALWRKYSQKQRFKVTDILLAHSN
jgi:hypothetical protein